MADAPGTEQPTDNPDERPWPSEPAPEASDTPTERPWPAEQSQGSGEGPGEEPWPAEQIRRTDADRWAASFSGIGDQPDSAVRQDSAATHDPADSAGQQQPAHSPGAGSQHQPWPDPGATLQQPPRTESNPVPPAEPSWRTGAGSGSGWGQDSPGGACDRPDTPATPGPWSTEVPSGFGWGPDSIAPSAGQGSDTAHEATAHADTAHADTAHADTVQTPQSSSDPPASDQAAGTDRGGHGWTDHDRPTDDQAPYGQAGSGQPAHEESSWEQPAHPQPSYRQSAHAEASSDQTEQPRPANPPPPPPAGYPSPPAYAHQHRTDPLQGSEQYSNQPYPGQQYAGQQYAGQQYGGQQHGNPPYAEQQFPVNPPAYGEPSQGGWPPPDQQAGGHAYPRQRSEAPPGSQSGWSAATTAAPSLPPPPQQWQQPQPPAPGWQRADQQAPPVPQHTSAADLTAGSLVKPNAAVPKAGWRKVVHAVTGGTVNPGLSPTEVHRRNLIERATAPVRGCHRIAVVSLKGGIGKTTTTAGLGLTLAEHRGDRVVALDANPDAGTLAERLTGQVDVTVRDLLDNVDSIRSFTDVSAFTSLAARLQVLASDQDPELSEAFSEEEYRTVSDILGRYFNIVLTDSGTGLLHSAMSGTLALADTLVVVGSPSVDGAGRASKTLDWLIAHGHGELVSRAVAVISTVRPATKELDMSRLREHFAARVRAVVEIPYDRHLVTGGIINIAQFDRPTDHAYLELAATVADGFRLPPLTRPERDPAGRSRG